MKTGTKEYYAEYYQKNKNKHNQRIKDYKANCEKQQLYEIEYHKKKYLINKQNISLEELQEKWRNQASKILKVRRDFIKEYKATCVCNKCDESRTHVLDFHHIDPTQKIFNLGEATTQPIQKIVDELKKCIPLCRNCHADFHYFEKTKGITIQQYLAETT